MSLLHCVHCHKPLSVTQRHCPHCGQGLSLLGEIGYQVEHSKLWLAVTVVLMVLLLGVGWFVRMDTGVRWPLYLTIILCAPLVPWLLMVAYKKASPVQGNKLDGGGTS